MRVHTLLSELVAAQFQVTGCWNSVYPDLIVGIHIIAHERRMDLAPDENHLMDDVFNNETNPSCRRPVC